MRCGSDRWPSLVPLTFASLSPHNREWDSNLPRSISLPASRVRVPTRRSNCADQPIMASGNDSSDLSSLSSLSPAPSEDELEVPSDVEPQATKKGILSYFSKASDLPPKEPSPPPRKRSPSPPHEYVLADNPDIAVCFRSTSVVAFCHPAASDCDVGRV